MRFELPCLSVSDSRFFYPTNDNGEYWAVEEQIFFLARGLRWDYEELMRMPLHELQLYVERLRAQYDYEQKEIDKAKHKK